MKMYHSGKKMLMKNVKMKSQFKHELLQSRIETQEHSFNHISTELHDNIGQLLSTTKLLLGMAAMELQQPPDTLKTAEQTLAQAIVDLRTLSKSLNSEWFHHFNFVERLEAEKGRINAAQTVKVEFTSDYQNLPLEPEEQLILFRTVQQGLLNIIERAQASYIRIEIKNTGASFELIIESDAHINIEPVKKETTELKKMDRRIKLLEGSIEWKLNAANNTLIKIKIPVKE